MSKPFAHLIQILGKKIQKIYSTEYRFNDFDRYQDIALKIQDSPVLFIGYELPYLESDDILGELGVWLHEEPNATNILNANEYSEIDLSIAALLKAGQIEDILIKYRILHEYQTLPQNPGIMYQYELHGICFKVNGDYLLYAKPDGKEKHNFRKIDYSILVAEGYSPVG